MTQTAPHSRARAETSGRRPPAPRASLPPSYTGAGTTWPAWFSSAGKPVTEEIAQDLARATDQVTRDEREVGRYGVARQKFLIVGPHGSPIIPDGVEPPARPEVQRLGLVTEAV